MDLYSDREIYRQRIKAKDLIYYRVTLHETDLFVGTDKNYHDIIKNKLVNDRKIIDEHIANNANFLESLSPIGYNVNDNIIIKDMCIASEKAGVGPMATVAGLFSRQGYLAVKDLSNQVIIENGGDILIKSHTKKTCALYAGKSPLSMKIGVKVGGSDRPCGICTSAKSIGHSLSFGNADLAMVISYDILLADGLATRLGNMIKTKHDLKNSIEFIYNNHDVIGAVGIIGEDIAAVGDLELNALK